MKKTNAILWAASAAVMLSTAGCSLGDGASSGDSISGQGGSMARFTINGDYLYTVDQSSLNVVSLADPAKPLKTERIYIGTEIETIFTMKDYLFIGSQGAMYIYDVNKPEFPERISATSHFKSCDPVVASGDLAFVTLNSTFGSWCGNRGNALLAYDITDLKNPELVGEYISLTSPRGLAFDDGLDLVFVCDGGIKAFDVTDPAIIKGLYTATSLPEVKKVDAYDCIALGNGTLLVIGADGLYQLAYDRQGFTFVSKIDLRTSGS